MAKLNTMKTIKGIIGKINERYDMTYDDIEVIRSNSQDDWDLICNGFRLGYAQGIKAVRAEMRRVNN
jgi:hypothetical protein